MSPHVSSPSDSSRIELEIVVNWRMVALGAALAALLVIIPAIGFLCFTGRKTEPTAQPVAAESSRSFATAPRAESPRFRIDPAAIASLAPAPRPLLEMPEAVPSPAAETPRLSVPKATSVVQADRAETAPARQAGRPRPFRTLAPSFGDEFERLRQLCETVPEFDLSEASKKPLLEAAQSSTGATKDAKKERISILDLAAKYPEIKGLPLRQAKDCTKKKEAAQQMQTISLRWRKQRVPDRKEPSRDPGMDVMNDLTFAKMLANECTGYGIEELATLVQMFQTKGYPVRLQLVKMLDSCRDARSSVLLAERALFDLNEEVRLAAIATLARRPRTEYRSTLLDGFRHPWPPVAHHAAEALTALQDLDAVPKLAALLDDADPAAPRCESDGKWTVKELVRINHLRNCVMCHAPSSDEREPVRAPIPSPGKELPVVYYSSIRGPAIRADITYLRQDFSVLQPVADAAPWPTLQRFDYLVRQRELTGKELQERFNSMAGKDATEYPQRNAVLFALRELTGEDVGTSGAEWRRLVGRIGLDELH